MRVMINKTRAFIVKARINTLESVRTGNLIKNDKIRRRAIPYRSDLIRETNCLERVKNKFIL